MGNLNLSQILGEAKRAARHKVNEFLREMTPKLASEEPLSVQAYHALAEHHPFSSLLRYRWFDEERNLIEMDSVEGTDIRVGFGVQIHPLMMAGKAAESALEAVITNAPYDSVIMFASLSTGAVRNRLMHFAAGRKERCNDPLLHELADARARWLMERTSKSISEMQRYFVRDVNYYVFVTCTFAGNIKSKTEIDEWLEEIVEYRNSVLGSLDGAQLAPSVMTRRDFDNIIKFLANPHTNPDDLLEMDLSINDWPRNAVLKQTRLRVLPNGGLHFSNGDSNDESGGPGAPEVVAVPMTVDAYPDDPEGIRLYQTHALIGSLMSTEDRVPPPYWLYTIVHRPHPTKIRDAVQMRLGWISKQCLSDSEWYKQMVPHLFARRNDTQFILHETRQNRQIVRMMTGITLFCEPKRVRRDADYVASLWNKECGIRVSREPYISLPIYLASMPFMYDPEFDKPTKGLQRAQIVTSLNAVTMAICQGDWKGNSPWRNPNGGRIERSGIPLVSRRGQLALFDVFNSPTSYNFVVIATSGAGKSFFTNELVVDILSRGGIVRLIDVGGSYKKICERMKGQYIRFDPNNPMSINPFYGLTDRKTHPEGFDYEEDREDHGEFGEMLGLLTEVVMLMCHPLGIPENSDEANYKHRVITECIENAHARAGYEMGAKDLYEYMAGHEEQRVRDLAVQLKPYAIGRYAAWFNGKPSLHFDNRLVVLEMEELNNDRDLRQVVLLMTISNIARNLYLTPRSINKLMVVDEAWDLLGDVKGGAMIETAFRRIRKYGGAAGIITQSLADRDISRAARAAFDNSPWKLLLKQDSGSIAYARETKVLGNDEWVLDLITSIKPTAWYSELMIKGPVGEGVFRFPVDREAYYTYTTNAADLARMEALEKQGVPIEEIVRRLAAADYERERERLENAT